MMGPQLNQSQLNVPGKTSHRQREQTADTRKCEVIIKTQALATVNKRTPPPPTILPHPARLLGITGWIQS